MLTGDAYTINIAEPSGEQFSRSLTSSTLFANFFANCSSCLDICCLFSPLSRNYDPSKRILYLPGTPEKHTALPIKQIADYYQLAIYTIHPELLELKQAVLWPGDLHLTTDPGLISDLPFGINLPLSLGEHAVARSCAVFEMARSALNAVSAENPHGTAMFQLIVEENSVAGFFSAALLQTLLRGQIPVYFGDPLIERWFNPKGIIPLTPNCIRDAAQKINEDFFKQAASARADNRERAKRWLDPMGLLAEEIVQRVAVAAPAKRELPLQQVLGGSSA